MVASEVIVSAAASPSIELPPHRDVGGVVESAEVVHASEKQAQVAVTEKSSSVSAPGTLLLSPLAPDLVKPSPLPFGTNRNIPGLLSSAIGSVGVQ